MVTVKSAREAALNLPEVEEKSHFDKPDFRVGKKVFAVLHEPKKGMVIKLSLTDQSVFCAFDATIYYPVAGGWGKKGWTFINLEKVKKEMFLDSLLVAWKTVAPIKLIKKYYSSEIR